MRFCSRWLLFTTLFCGTPVFAAVGGYDYPYSDPLVATILGTPTTQKAPLAEDMRVRLLDLTIFPERKVPEVLWFNGKLRCSLACQNTKAPLVFVIAGTGAGFNSDKMLALQSILYRAGFHVVSLSSPTHANFITAASESAAPGILMEDAGDLYRVMQKVWEKIGGDIEVSEFYLTGYSLGGSQAAFVSLIDERQKTFDFKKVLMINPAVSLYNSATMFDRMLEENIPGGVEKAGEFLRQLLDRFAEIYSTGDFVKFDNEFLFNIYRALPTPPKEENLAAMIGISFRLSAVNMMFATDVMTESGFVVPKRFDLDQNDPLDDYFRTLLRISFAQYLDELLLPIAQIKNPQLTRQQLIAEAGLKAIDGYLRQTGKIGVLTNEDDFILTGEELGYLKELFGARAKVYPRGAHCGNIDQQDVAIYITTFFAQP